ncbi:hypothetical protein GH811_15225 [Acetobacterium malicum]|uniref:Aromatic acid exporter C-terminal domain-containing protein n=1 Tax=Acetobacterium malicum TaxID=52692 RepID=A0ABR6Z1F8_9FIRM|nr:hypothetical protein [Acetobacterium malicum]MBC3900967.1 hypothetical protein [Acetobacterium malicum]
MKKYSKGILIGIGFITLSAILYYAHFLIFKDSHHIFLYLLGDIAFLPIEVLLVSVIFHKAIEDKDKKERLKKINMVLSVYFSEAGVELMQFFSREDDNLSDFQEFLLIKPQWDTRDYKNALKNLKAINHRLNFSGPCLISLRDFLTSHRDLFLKLLENPFLVEHETFTDLIMSLSHAEQELSSRKNLLELNENDYCHLMTDIERAYKLLLVEWLLYMNHLRKSYSFLYSFSIRTNPFDPNAEVEIPGKQATR